MYRLVVLLFALLLPLQLAWGVAAAYCQHERAPHTEQHVGHHVHEHKDDAKQPGGAKLALDGDCSVCHAACHALMCDMGVGPQAVPPQGRPAMPGADAPSSAPARAPDRPQWPRLA